MASGPPLGVFVNDLAPFSTAAFNNAAEGMIDYAATTFAQAFVEAEAAAGRAVSKQLSEIARVLREGIDQTDFTAIHEAVGAAGQRSILASYDQTVGRGPSSGYRSSGKWQRYSGGRLRAALASSEFYRATPEGLYFINIDLLNRRAAQWARLNFGAGPRGRGSNLSVDIRFSQIVVASLGIHEPARPGFDIPTGYFVSGSQVVAPRQDSIGDEFHVAGSGPFAGQKTVTNAEGEQVRLPMIKRKPTLGIHARQFLNPGVIRIAEEIPVRYKQKINDLYREGRSAVRPAAVTVRPIVSGHSRGPARSRASIRAIGEYD